MRSRAGCSGSGTGGSSVGPDSAALQRCPRTPTPSACSAAAAFDPQPPLHTSLRLRVQVGVLLDRADLARTSTRVVARELLAACVLRPLMMYFTPYYAHKGLFYMLREAAPPRGAAAAAAAAAAEGAEPEELSVRLAKERAAQMCQHFQFEQRLA